MVLTKSDKASAAEREERVSEFGLLKRAALHPALFMTSSETGEGIAELRAELASLAAPVAIG